jgi:exonuclease III
MSHVNRNINSIHNSNLTPSLKKYKKRNRVVEWIKTQKCSIAFLQETHLDENIENEIKNKTNFAIYCSNGTSTSRGVGIVINKSLNYEYPVKKLLNTFVFLSTQLPYFVFLSREYH